MLVKPSARAGDGAPLVGTRRVVFVANQTPLSRQFLRAWVEQCSEVLCVNLNESAGAIGGLLHARDAVPVFVLAPWTDLLGDSPERAAASLAARLGRIGESGAGRGRVTICTVPYGSFGDSAHRVDEYLHPAVESSSGLTGATDPSAALAAFLLAAGWRVQVARAPMVLCRDLDESAGYVSAVHTLVRVARCLTDEVATKVCDYFSRYDLTLRCDTFAHVNVATPSDIVRSLLDHWREEHAMGHAIPLVHLGNPVPWPTFAERLKVFGLTLSLATRASELNALDELFNELVVSAPGLRADRRLCASELTPRRVASDDLWDTLRQVSSRPAEPWETDYVALDSLDLDRVGGLPKKRLDGGRVALDYREGGTGPAVVLIPPFGFDAGYFAAIVRGILADHRVILPEFSGSGVASGEPRHIQDVDALTASIHDLLDRERIETCHLVAWCGGVRIAARLVDRCPARLRSLSLLAPVVCEAEHQTEGYKSALRFVTRLVEHPEESEHLVAQTRKALQAKPSANLDQYGARAADKRSPLQYHPDWFWTSLADDLFGDPDRIVWIAQESLESIKDAAFVAATLARYGGPILVIAGTHDGLIGCAGVRASCRQFERWTLATVLGGNHYCLLEHGAGVVRLLRQFFRDASLEQEPPRMVQGGRIRLERGGREAGSVA